MNLALPTILTVLGLLPGIVFFHSYFSGRFPRQLAGISAISEVALYVVFAIPLGLLASWFLGVVGKEIKFELIGLLLAGSPTGEAGRLLGRYLEDEFRLGAFLYLLLLFAALILGNLCRRLVWALRLDVRFPFLRLKHEWFYTVTGRLPNLPRGVVPSVDILVGKLPRQADS